MNVRIDHLVLDGLPIAPHQAPALRSAICSALAALLVGAEVAGGAVVAAPDVVADTDPAVLGRRIAASIHCGLVGGGR